MLKISVVNKKQSVFSELWKLWKQRTALNSCRRISLSYCLSCLLHYILLSEFDSIPNNESYCINSNWIQYPIESNYIFKFPDYICQKSHKIELSIDFHIINSRGIDFITIIIIVIIVIILLWALLRFGGRKLTLIFPKHNKWKSPVEFSDKCLHIFELTQLTIKCRETDYIRGFISGKEKREVDFRYNFFL